MTTPSPSSPAKRWSPWPVGIVLYFVGFAVLCVVFAIKASGVRTDLVADDYYQQGVDFDARMAAVARTQALTPKAACVLEDKTRSLRLDLPEHSRDIRVTLYRPSDARLDQVFSVEESPEPRIPLTDVAPGLWTVEVAWNLAGEPYFFKEDLFL